MAYTVVIAEDDTKNASGLEMPSWRDVQAYSTWPPYQVLYYLISILLTTVGIIHYLQLL